MTTAILIGATGLTGSALVRQLLEDGRFASVTALTRRSTGVSHAKFRETLVDFEKPLTWAGLVHADVAFSTLGTTRQDAGSVEAQRRVDFDYQLAFAQAAASNQVPSFVLLSSGGASATSKMAYLKMKGELDEAVGALGIPRVRILRPGVLDGKRAKTRRGEHASIAVARFVTGLGIARDYRPISVETVAQAMIAAAFDGPEPRRIYTLGQVFALAGV
jgi:uncharacterized protein YbjT (DUF2867 family)